MAHNTKEIENILLDDSENIVNVKKEAAELPKKGEFKPKKSKQKDLLYCQQDKLAIVGTAETMPMAPYNDLGYEIWGVSVCTTYPAFKRGDVVYEMHEKSYWQRPEIIERLNKFEGPTFMLDHYKEVPKSVRFPIDVIVDKYRRYHTTSITYMLAWAYHSFIETGKPYHVALFGIHMASREEYTEQRPACEYWLGRMEGAGIDIMMAPGGSVLTSNGLYGYEGYHPAIPKLRDRLTALQAGSGQAESEAIRWEKQKIKNDGAISECEYWMRQYQLGNVGTGVGGV